MDKDKKRYLKEVVLRSLVELAILAVVAALVGFVFSGPMCAGP